MQTKRNTLPGLQDADALLDLQMRVGYVLDLLKRGDVDGALFYLRGLQADLARVAFLAPPPNPPAA